jgi:hypothetical protein
MMFDHKKTLKENTMALSLVIVLILIMIAGLWARSHTKNNTNKTDKATATAQLDVAKPKENKFSRISFFHTMPIKGSLAIPEHWEGKYRKREEGDTVYLDYIGNATTQANIMYIRSYPDEKWQTMAKTGSNIEKEANTLENYVFVYSIASQNPYKGGNADEFRKMTDEASEILKSLRLFHSK